MRMRFSVHTRTKGLGRASAGQQAISASEAKSHGAINFEVPVRFRRRGTEAKLVILGQSKAGAEADANLVKLLMRAHDWFGTMARGEATLGEIARSERLCRTFVIRVLCLAFLAPDITETILKGRQPTELTAKRLVKHPLKFPPLWTDQNTFFGILGKEH